MPKRLSVTMILSLEERIRSGALKPGDKLPPETELGESFGISRTVVREGLQALKSRGLIESRRGSGTYVAVSTREMIGDSISLYASLRRDGERYLELMDLRILVESESARLVAAGNASLRGIRRHLQAMENTLHHPARFAEADIDFHRAIIEASRHSLFFAVAMGLLSAPSLAFARSTHRLDPSRSEVALREHRDIFLALEKRDPRKAAKAMHSHLRRSRNNLLNRLSESAVTPE